MKRTLRRLGMGLMVTALLLCGAEGLLRLLQPDLQDVRSPLSYQETPGKIYLSGKAPGSRVYTTGRRRLATDHPAGIRVLVVGASAAYGEMFSEFSAFPGWAQRYLRAAAPDQTIEILNLAHGGMGSRQVKEMVSGAVRHDRPDMIVVYSGNNEYHEIRALKAASDRYDPQGELLRRRMNQSYLYRQVRDLVAPAEDIMAPPEGITWLPIGRLDVLVDDADRKLGRLLYREHLDAMIAAADDAQIPIMIATVPTNLRDHMDNATPGEITQEAENKLHDLGQNVDKLSSAEMIAQARLLESEIQTEGAQYQLGHLFLRAGLDAEAHQAFEQSEALALRPMQADKYLRSQVLTATSAAGVPVCDLAQVMADGSPNGIPGSDVFIDHCHPNADGLQRLGRGLAQCIAREGLLPGLTEAEVEEAANALDAQAPDPYRLDHFTGHRKIPGLPQPTLADPGTALGATQQGHRAFVEGLYPRARKAYARAKELGAPAGATAVNQAHTALYLLDLPAARSAAKAAAVALPDDPDVVQLKASLR